MATQHSQDLTVGSLISGAADHVRVNLQPALLYVGAFTAAGALVDATSSDNAALGGAFGIAYLVATIVAGYLVLEIFLEKAGLLVKGAGRNFLGYIGQSIVMGLAIAIGLILLIVPGVYLAARWAIAQGLLVGRHANAMDALSLSWEETDGHVLTIVGAALGLFVPLILGLIVIVGLLGESSMIGMIVSNLVQTSITVVGFGFVTEVFSRLRPGNERTAEVFR